MTTLENKIYIQNFSIDEIKPLLNRIDGYFKNKVDSVHLYSKDEGIFLVENGSVFHLKQIDQPIKYYKDLIETKTNRFSVILDESYYEKTPVISQLPVDYLSVPTTTFKFYNSPLVCFIVEGIMQQPNPLCKNNKSHYDLFTPLDFYFTTNENIENKFVKEELSVFLSLFN
jgi:hypothetical protein